MKGPHKMTFRTSREQIQRLGLYDFRPVIELETATEVAAYFFERMKLGAGVNVDGATFFVASSESLGKGRYRFRLIGE